MAELALVEGTARKAVGPDANGMCLAAICRATWRELGADDVLVSWHAAQHDPLVLFSAGACCSSPQRRAWMAQLAGRAAEGCAGSTEPEITDAQSTHRRFSILAIPLTDGVVTVAAGFNSAMRSNHGESLIRLAPMLQPFFRLWAASRKLSARFSGLIAAVNNLDVATFALSRAGEVLFINEAGDRLVALKDGIERRGGKLSGATLADTLRVHAAIDHLFSAPASRQVTPVIALQRSNRRPLMVTFVAAEIEEGSSQEEVAIAYVFDPEQDLTELVGPACKLYGLSSSETRLACRLAGGATLAEAAKTLGVREQTVRSYLKQIFLKTETNRQAELVSLLLKSSIHVSNPDRVRVF